MDDRELVQKLINKDPMAEQYFFSAYKEKLYQACTYLLGYQDPEAEDIAQEAFMVALRKLPEFEFRSSLYRWLYRICVFLCYKRIRARNRQVAHLDEQLEAMSGPLAVEREFRDQQDLETQKIMIMIRQQRDLMGAPCRDLLVLRDDEEKSYALISELLKIPMGTVMSRLARCKEALKQLVLLAVKEGTRA